MIDFLEKPNDAQKILLRCLGEAVFRIPAELCLVKDNWLPSPFSEHEVFTRFKRPTRWRLNVWKKLLKTSLKDFVKFKPKPDIKTVGIVMGTIERNRTIIDSIDEEGDQIFEKALELNTSLQINWDEVEKKLGQFQQIPNLEDFGKLVQKEKPSELGELYSGYGQGLNLVSTIDKNKRFRPSNATTATEIYWLLLVFGDYFQEMDTVEDVYGLLKNGMNEGEMPHSLEDFQRLCNRIGFRGRLYRESKKRVNRRRSKG